MALASRIGSILKQAKHKQINVESSLLSPSVYQAVRCMSSSKLFVGGLAYATDEGSLRGAFSQYGKVTEAKVIVDRASNTSKGFGFVSFSSAEEASHAKQFMDGQDLHGRILRVDFAADRPRPGGFGGGGHGGGSSYYGGDRGYGGGGNNQGGGYGNYSGGYGGGNNQGGGYGNYSSGGGSSGGYGGGSSGGYSGGSSSGYSGGSSSGNYGVADSGSSYSAAGGSGGEFGDNSFPGSEYGGPTGIDGPDALENTKS